MSVTKAQFTEPKRPEVRMPLFDADAVERAERAIEALSGEFDAWLKLEIDKLQLARLAAEEVFWAPPALHAVFAAAHELKGVGTTFGYPLATEIAASLCRLVETDAGKAAVYADPALARAHIDALRAVARDKIANPSHPTGAALLGALEAGVATLGAISD